MAQNNSTKSEKFEVQLFKAADKLRKNIDAAEYKHIVLGLIFLKYISDSFEELHIKLKEGKGQYEDADPEDQDEYKAVNVFWVPQGARWSYLHSRAKLPTIGKDLDEAMEAIEEENPTLKGILPKVYAKPNLDKTSLGGLIDLVGDVALGDEAGKSKDILGKVYEYFLGEFALAEGKKGGQFYTPKSIVKLLTEMIEPYHGRVFDPCCGSGGMFVMSEKFVEEHQGRLDDISIYGQESNQTTYRLCRMNLAIRGIDGSQVKWNNEGSFLKNAHPDLKADFVLANPPFNDSDWSGELLQSDGRWKYGVPPKSNANFAWVQDFVYHLSPKGVAGFVLAKGSLTSKTSGEDIIRKNLVEAGLLDAIVNLPTKLFLNTQIPACLWFVSNKRHGFNGDRNRAGQILFIDARNLGHLINRRTREFSDEDIAKIANIYHEWRKEKGNYRDEPGFCASVSIEKAKESDYVLSPGRATISILETVQKEGTRQVKRKTEYYNLDAILSVGYRVNSKQATRFRIWATKTLKQHLLQGYTINKKRIGNNYQKFMRALEDVKALLPGGNAVSAKDALELINVFAVTWFSLDVYDTGNFPQKGVSEKQVSFTAKELAIALQDLKKVLIARKQATELFGQEKSKDAVGGIVGNVLQSFGKKDIYPTIEEKAAHLFYFMVKNHPFVDGNKRSGAFSFVWFLRKAGVLRTSFTPESLTALTLLVAESKPKDRGKIIGLVLLLLRKDYE